MRTLKFRPWNTRTKVMYPSFTLKDKYIYAEMEGLEIMQFTGLLDKHGKEIYEGDIVKDKYNQLLEIAWDDNGVGFAFKTNLKHYWINYTNSFNKCLEVIGNIYENSDLLK